MSKLQSSIQELHTLWELADGDTVIHRLNPMVKLGTALLFILVVVSYNRYDLTGLIPYIFYPVVLMALSGTPYLPLLKRLVLALPFVLFAGLSNLLFDHSITACLSVILKTSLTVMAGLILVATTTMQDMTGVLARLKIPPVLLLQLSMTYRYLEILVNEASSMYHAYLLRAPKAKGIAMKDMGSFLGQLILRSMDRSEAVYHAMKCRGFSKAMVFAEKKPFTATDIIWCVSIIAALFVQRLVNIPAFLGGIFIS